MKTSIRMKIDGLDFDIYDIDIEQKYSYINYGNYSTKVPSNQSIKMIGTTSNQNYTKLDKWFSGVFNTNPLGYAKNYKKNFIFNTIQMYGVFPIDYDFTPQGIKVTFSIDYINGDIKLFEIQQLRKEKLKKLNSLQ